MKNRFQWLAAAVIGLGLAALAPGVEAALNSAQFDLIRQEQGQGANITITGTVWIKGDKFRLDLKHPMMGEQILIGDGRDVYILSPQQRAGQKRPFTQNGKKVNVWQMVAADVNELKRQGKKVGRETVEGIACDVYVRSQNLQGATFNVKAWVGTVQGTAVPMKVIMSRSIPRPGGAGTFTGSQTMLIKNLKPNVSIADSQFSVPKGYNIGTGQGGPGMPMPRPGGR